MATTPEELYNSEFERYKIQQQIEESLIRQERSIGGYLQTQKSIQKGKQEILKIENSLKNLEKDLDVLSKSKTKENKNLAKLLKEQQKDLIAQKDAIQAANTELAKQSNIYKSIGRSIGDGINDQLRNTGEYLKAGWQYLMLQDDAIRTLNNSLGLTSTQADFMRTSMVESQKYAAGLGLEMKDLATIQKGYADSTGRVLHLNNENLKAITAMAGQSFLGADGAAQMAGSFSNIGIRATRTKDFLEKTLNNANKTGINASKVVKDINQNFQKAQGYVFKGGVDGIRKMAEYANKMNIDMSSAFAVADKARGLEGAIEMGAQLQVLGDQFANADPMRLFHLARTDMKAFTEETNKMIKGIHTFNTTTGQVDVSAANLDRLKMAAEAFGISQEEIIKQSQELAKTQAIGSKLFGFKQDDKDFIAKVAQFNEKSKKFEVDINGSAVSIEKLSQSQLALLRGQEQTLEERAKEAMNFDKQFQATINELKTGLMPILTYINDALKGINNLFGKTEEGQADGFGKSIGKAVLMTLIPAFAISLPSLLAKGIAEFGLKGIMGGIGGLFGKFGSLFGKGGKDGGTDDLSKTTKNVNDLGKTAGASALKIVAFGVAMVGVGFGLKLATEGFAKLADSMKQLDTGQIVGLVAIATVLAGAIIGLGMAGTIAAPGLYGIAATIASVGVAAAGMGLGVNLAAEGLASLVNSFKDTPAIDMNTDFPSMKLAFDSANKFMEADSSNLHKLRDAIKELSTLDTTIFKQLESLFNKELTVKFSGNQSVEIKNNITLQIDGNVLADVLVPKIAKITYDAKNGRGSAGKID
jgi:hypothetical protein